MRLLIVTNMYPSPEHPAYGIFIKEQLDAITSTAHDIKIDIYVIDASESRMAYMRSISAVHAMLRSGKYEEIQTLGREIWLGKLKKVENLEMSTVGRGLSGLFLLRDRPGIPVVLTLHGGDILPEQNKRIQVALTHRILRRVDASVTLNKRMSMMASRYCRNIVEIPCGTDMDLFTPAVNNRHYPSCGDPLTIIFPSSRHRIVKNYPLFHAAVEEYRNRFGVAIKEVELDGLTRRQTVRAMQTADLMLLTSISEGSPQVVKEAMACRLPVVATPVGDVATLLDGVSRCRVAGSHDPQLLATLMHEALYDPAGYDSRDRLQQLQLDADSVSRRIISLYRTLTARTPQ